VSELILYRTDDGHAEGGSVWLNQGEIAALLATTKQNIRLHVRNVLEEKTLSETSVVKDSLTTAADGKRNSTRRGQHG